MHQVVVDHLGFGFVPNREVKIVPQSYGVFPFDVQLEGKFLRLPKNYYLACFTEYHKYMDVSELYGMVFSTNPESFAKEEAQASEEGLAERQTVIVGIERKHRAGKVVTYIKGFKGNAEQMNSLSRELKTQCGTGGSVDDGIIYIQGDKKVKLSQILKNKGFTVKISG